MGQTLACRIKQHKKATERENTDVSAVEDHAWNNDHKIDYEAAEVLDVKQERYKRCVVESWYIKLEEEPVNRDQGVLPQIYTILQ